jgi:lysozyme
MIKRHEGNRLKGGRHFAYMDTMGKLTIGYGRCLDDIGISEDEALALLEHDLIAAENAVESLSLGELGEARRAALVDMAFNLGAAGLGKFKLMLEALRQGKWDLAAVEALDSDWADQVGKRAEEIARIIRTGTA